MDEHQKQQIIEAMEAQTATNKTVADCVLENTQLMRIVAEELRADRQIDHHRLMDAVKTLEASAKKIDAIAKKAELAAKNAYDAYVAAEALSGQLEQPLKAAAEAAALGAEAAVKSAEVARDGVEHMKTVKKSVDDMTGEFKTIRDTRDDGGKKRFAVYLEFFRGVADLFSKLPPLSRVLLTILAVVFIGGAVTVYIYHVTSK